MGHLFDPSNCLNSFAERIARSSAPKSSLGSFYLLLAICWLRLWLNTEAKAVTLWQVIICDKLMIYKNVVTSFLIVGKFEFVVTKLCHKININLWQNCDSESLRVKMNPLSVDGLGGKWSQIYALVIMWQWPFLEFTTRFLVRTHPIRWLI